MSWAAAAVTGATVVGGMVTSGQQAESQAAANRANAAMSAQQLNEQRHRFDLQTGRLSQSRREREDAINLGQQQRFDEQIKRLDPFSQAGQRAVGEQSAFLGLSGAPAQQEAFGRFDESAGQAFLRERQEKALVRNASRIGGLGGGNIRTALQEQAFGRAQTDLDRHMDRLSGVSGQGLQAAGRQIGGPARVQTGVDVGVGDLDPRAPLPPVKTASGGGGGPLDFISDAVGGFF